MSEWMRALPETTQFSDKQIDVQRSYRNDDEDIVCVALSDPAQGWRIPTELTKGL